MIAFELSAYANMPIAAYVRSRAGLTPSISFEDVAAHARAALSPSDPCPFREVLVSPPHGTPQPRAPPQSTVPEGQGDARRHKVACSISRSASRVLFDGIGFLRVRARLPNVVQDLCRCHGIRPLQISG